MSNDVLNKILGLLLENKKFPNYHAERRIDIFINYFLTRILSQYLDRPVEFICPEFPIKKEKNNQSTKLDYLCKSGTEMIFVELKTDKSSFSEEQSEIYLKCDWNDCVKNLKQIIKAVKIKDHKLKYVELDSAISKIESKNISRIRVIYISPVIDSKKFKNTTPKNIQAIGKIDIKPQGDENVIWEFIKSLDLSVFEITHKLNKQ